jgi:hypothetical protein
VPARLWLSCVLLAASCETSEPIAGISAGGAGAPASTGGAGVPANPDASAGTGGTGAGCGDTAVEYLAPTCTFVVCHDGQSGNPLDLLGPGLPQRLVGQQSSSLNCAGLLYIDPAAPEQSLILRKLDADPPCGDRMPPAALATPAERACLLAWISAAVAKQ